MTQITNIRPQVSFGEAITIGFKKYATFTGRARRSEFWWWQLFAFLMGLLSMIPFLGWIIAVGMILPNLAIAVRRLHDIGRSGWWLLAPICFSFIGWLLIGAGALVGFGGYSSSGGFTAVIGGIALVAAFVTGIVLFIWDLSDSKVETNQYGPSPKYEIAEEEVPTKPEVRNESAPVAAPIAKESAPVKEGPTPIKDEPTPIIDESTPVVEEPSQSINVSEPTEAETPKAAETE